MAESAGQEESGEFRIFQRGNERTRDLLRILDSLQTEESDPTMAQLREPVLPNMTTPLDETEFASKEAKLFGLEAKRLRVLLDEIGSNKPGDGEAYSALDWSPTEQAVNLPESINEFEKGQIVHVRVTGIQEKRVHVRLTGSKRKGVIYKEEIPSTWFRQGMLDISKRRVYKARIMSVNEEYRRVKLSLKRVPENHELSVQSPLISGC